MTEAELRSKVVSIMQGWIGRKESDGSHKTIIDTYNSHTPRARSYKVTYTDAWCAATVSAAFIEAGLTDIAPTECSCSQMISLYRAKGWWKETDSYTPEIGDLMMYDWDDTGSGDNTGAPEHVGMVEKVSGTTITVIEGNKDNAVGRRTMTVNGKYIRGYCLPDYAAKAEEEDDMDYYRTVNDVPTAYRASVKKLVDAGVLKGTGGSGINVSEDFCRVMTVLDRLGVLGGEG